MNGPIPSESRCDRQQRSVIVDLAYSISGIIGPYRDIGVRKKTMNGLFNPLPVRMLLPFLWIPTVAILSETPSSAREVKTWTTDELYQASDTVVVVRFLSWKQIDWEFDEAPWPKLFAGEVGDYMRKHIMAREAEFRVESVMKGSVASKTVRVLLCDFTPAKNEIENGPRFYPKELAQTKDGPTLLLFLTKSTEEGRYRPTTGHFDPIDSVQVLLPPGTWSQLNNRELHKSSSDEKIPRMMNRMEEIRSQIKASDAEHGRKATKGQ